MSAFRQASKHLLFRIMKLVTEQQTEHTAFRFVYFRTLSTMRNDILDAYRGDPEIDQVYVFMTMFGEQDNASAAGRMFSEAVHAVIQNGAQVDVSILCLDRGYTALPEVTNIIVKPQSKTSVV